VSEDSTAAGLGAPAGPAGGRAPAGGPDTAAPPADALDPTRLPRHVGIIMDGNGRWARARGLPREEGHEKGADSVRTVVRAARRIGIPALTLFAFSSQNWDRPPEEVFHLMELLRRYLVQERAEILDNGIRLVTVGEPERLPAIVRAPLVELMAASAKNGDMVLCLALSYGGREMITKAARELCRLAAAGRLDPDDVDQDVLEAHLDSARLLPPLDLLIRTSGEHRISNFFLWETAYAELYFTEKLWPEFGREDLMAALVDFAGRERRFGQTSEQVAQRERGAQLDRDGTGGGSAAGAA
jgi:undecaprenyl diphosphate synthase